MNETHDLNRQLSIDPHPYDMPRLKGLLERWLSHADSGLWRDRTGLGLKAVQVVDDTRAALASLESK